MKRHQTSPVISPLHRKVLIYRLCLLAILRAMATHDRTPSGVTARRFLREYLKAFPA